MTPLLAYSPKHTKNKTRFTSITMKMCVAFGLLFTMVLLLFVLVEFYGVPFADIAGERDMIQTDALEKISVTADIKKENLSRWIARQRADLEKFTENPVTQSLVAALLSRIHGSGYEFPLGLPGNREKLLQDRNEKKLLAYLDEFKRTGDFLEVVLIADKKTGIVIASTSPEEIGTNIGQKEYFFFPEKSGQTYVGFEYHERDGGYDLFLSRPFTSSISSGSSGGNDVLAVLNIDSKDLFSLFLNTADEPGKTTEVILVNNDARLLTPLKFPVSNVQSKPFYYRLSTADALMAAQEEEGVTLTSDYRGVKTLSAFRYLPIDMNKGWGMVVKRDMSEVFAPLQKKLSFVAIIGLSCLIVALGFTYAMARHFSNPLKTLSKAALEVEAGNLDSRVPLFSSDETGILANAFNAMMDRIRQRTGMLHAIGRAQSKFIRNADLSSILEELLRSILSLTGSTCGFIIDISLSEEGRPMPGPLAVSAGEGNGDASLSCHDRYTGQLWDTLYHTAARAGTAIVLLKDSPLVKGALYKNALCVPFFSGDRMSGMMALFHKEEGYTQETIEYLEPVGNTCASLLDAYRNITLREEARASLQASEEKYRTLIDTANDAIVILDRQTGLILDINKKGEELFGLHRKELIGTPQTGLYPEGERNASVSLFTSHLAKGAPILEDIYIYHQGGAKVPVDIRAAEADLGVQKVVIAIFRDIAQRKQIEEQLREKSRQLEEINKNLDIQVRLEIDRRRKQEQMLIQQSRMAAMGEMIGSIAHQWRQPLNALSVLVFDLKDAYEYGELDGQYLEESVDKVLCQLQFMSGTIDDFRNFYKPSKVKTLFNVSDALAHVKNLVAGQLTHQTITLTIKEDDSGTLTTLGYPNEFKQALLNIINNARDAILEQKEHGMRETGEISLSLHRVKEKIILTIRDNAGGIPDSVMERIFEPYFTTKDEGKGTGIGLYMAKVIIENNMSGLLQAENKEKGAQFTVELKLAELE